MDCTKMSTPYGMRLTWELRSEVSDADGKPAEGMSFVIHLKDNTKVGQLDMISYLALLPF